MRLGGKIAYVLVSRVCLGPGRMHFALLCGLQHVLLHRMLAAKRQLCQRLSSKRERVCVRHLKAVPGCV